MSLHLRPNIPYADMPPYTMMVASSIVKAISRLTGIDTEIKWVNDIYLGKHKIAGILTEAITSVETGLITDVIIGVGLNFLSPTSQKPLLKRQVPLYPKTKHHTQRPNHRHLETFLIHPCQRPC